MLCPKCGNDDTKVLESRLSAEKKSIRRRRRCSECDYRFTTYEKEEEQTFHVRKRGGHAQPYQREKALRSIQIACQKRPVPIEKIEKMLGSIERRVLDSGEKTIPSESLGDLIMEGLSELDHVAYVRFASVYKDFKTPDEFLRILKSIDGSKEGAS